MVVIGIHTLEIGFRPVDLFRIYPINKFNLARCRGWFLLAQMKFRMLLLQLVNRAAGIGPDFLIKIKETRETCAKFG